MTKTRAALALLCAAFLPACSPGAEAHPAEECVCECPEPPILVCADGSEPVQFLEPTDSDGDGIPDILDIEPAAGQVLKSEPKPDQAAIERALKLIEQAEQAAEEGQVAK
jgi:hypothetical protein